MTDAPQTDDLKTLDERWLTAQEVAALTGWHYSTVYRKWDNGELPCIEPLPGTKRMTLGQFREFTARQMRGKIRV